MVEIYSGTSVVGTLLVSYNKDSIYTRPDVHPQKINLFFVFVFVLCISYTEVIGHPSHKKEHIFGAEMLF